MAPTSHNMYVPTVKKYELTLMDVTDDGFLTLMNDDGTTKEDLKCEDKDMLEKM